MKLKNFIICVLASIFMASCNSQLTTLENGLKIDNRLAGTWQGSEKDKQIEGVSKSWVMQRNSDGSFRLDFSFTQGGEQQKTVETGNWWIKDGMFYEKHNESGNTDIYHYTVLDKDHVKFVSKSISTEMNTDSYEFIDTRINSGKSTDSNGITNAIKVKSVQEEYAYIRKNCPGCELKSQSLIEKNKKPYDLIRVVKADGTEMDYYFDISSFFGKY